MTDKELWVEFCSKKNIDVNMPYEAWSFGFEEVNVSCLPENEGSRKTILANGGEFVETVFLDEDNVTLEKYRIRI